MKEEKRRKGGIRRKCEEYREWEKEIVRGERSEARREEEVGDR